MSALSTALSKRKFKSAKVVLDNVLPVLVAAYPELKSGVLSIDAIAVSLRSRLAVDLSASARFAANAFLFHNYCYIAQGEHQSAVSYHCRIT
jgi:hypothetical protein